MFSPRVAKIMMTTGYVANTATALLTIASGYGGMVNPEVSTIPAILAMTYPLWLFITITLLIVDLFTIKKIAIIPGLAIILTLGPLLSYSPLNLFPTAITESNRERSFTVMSYNSYGFADSAHPETYGDRKALVENARNGMVNPTMSYILQSGADIVCLQEYMFGLSEEYCVTRVQLDSLTTIYPHRTAVDGVAILSKFPLYPIHIRQPEDPSGMFAAAMVDIQGRKTLVVSAHFQSIGLSSEDKQLYHELTDGKTDGGRRTISEVKQQLLSKLSAAFRERARQAAMLRHSIDSIGVKNVIVAGDFNDIPDCYALRNLCGNEFKNAFSMAGFGPMITYHANRFYFNIDHIVYKGDMEAVNFNRGDCPRSDHYPIYTTFLWSPSSPKDDRGPQGIDLIHRDSTKTNL